MARTLCARGLSNRCLSNRTLVHRLRSDRGSASLEFITTGLILLVPLVYLVLAMSVLQGGALAVEGAARQAARVYVRAPSAAVAAERAQRAVDFALADYGLPAGDAQVTIDCAAAPSGCLTRRAVVTVTVRLRVSLPLVPDVLGLTGTASVPLQSSSTQTVSRFWQAGAAP
ncbi:hypothetical protein E3O44_03780 [Cryobacterium algoricola]|uniref:TadE family protein n=1 Tax=Cryobacterium algoricola TaxID=1259183 RepID=A0ABY2IJR1_9MICO|nr:hypothetical protein [Cryobacterium algoricola]TFB90713.1 hypothetical protein E3O44_03780 [Cryobacterium algoricola]